MNYNEIQQLLRHEAENLPGFNSAKLSKDLLHMPSPTFADHFFVQSKRNPQSIKKLNQLV